MFGLWCSFASTGILHWKVVSVYINRMGLVNESLLHAVQLWLRQFSDDVLLKGKKCGFAGNGEDEEPSCSRDDHEEEEK